MHILSNSELASRAGVDPWAEHNKLAAGDPAQVEELAATFAKAGGDLATSNAYQQTAQQYVGEGYTIDGSSPVDFDAQVKATADSPDQLVQIGRALAGIAGSLERAAASTGKELDALETTLTSIDTQWDSFLRQAGGNVSTDDQNVTRQQYIKQAVGATQQHGNAILKTVTGYEEHLLDAVRLLATLGYVPPDQLDDLSGTAQTDIDALQKKARDEADKLKDTGKWPEAAHQVAQDVAPYLDDPYFGAAFYAELGPDFTQSIPAYLQGSDDPTAAADLKAYSNLFGTAVTNAADAPAMQGVADSFLTAPKNPAESWNRAAMASSGSFPPDWLASAARVNALDPLAADPNQGIAGTGTFDYNNSSFAAQVGVPGNDVAAWTTVLGHNPQASREALATMGTAYDVTQVPADPAATYTRNIHTLIEYGHHAGVSPDVAKGYAAAFAAASGATTEQDGAHSQAAASFAKALFDDLGRDGHDVPSWAGQDFAKIAGSYVQELAAGHDAQGDHVLGVDPADRLPGDNPAFEIPPALAHELMTTFVADPRATATFDGAAGQAAHHAMLAGARADVDLLHHGQSAKWLNDASEAYGTVAGTENGAAIEVTGHQVENEEHDKELIRNLASAALDAIPGEGIAEQVPGLVWDALKHAGNMGLEQVYSGEPASAQQLHDLQNATFEVAMTADYERTTILQEAGYPGTGSVPAALLDGHGHMLDVATVMADPKLEQAYYDYLHSAAARAPQGTLGDGASVYELSRNAASRWVDGYDRAPHPTG